MNFFQGAFLVVQEPARLHPLSQVPGDTSFTAVWSNKGAEKKSHSVDWNTGSYTSKGKGHYSQKCIKQTKPEQKSSEKKTLAF